jgi:hypothetical protein
MTSAPTAGPTGFTVAITATISDGSKQDVFCNAVAHNAGGKLLTCDHIGSNRNLEEERTVEAKVEASDKDELSTMMTNSAHIVKMAAESSNVQATFVKVVGKDQGKIIVTTTTEAPSIVNTLRNYFGRRSVPFADNESHLNLLCSPGAAAAIKEGVSNREKWDERYRAYITWHEDHFNGAVPNFPAIDSAEYASLWAANRAGEADLKNACDEIGSMRTLAQVVDVVGDVQKIVANASPDFPPVTIWSVLHTKNANEELTKVVHNKLETNSKANDVFVNYCSDESGQMEAFIKEWDHFDTVSNYINNLGIDGVRLSHTYGNHDISVLKALSKMGDVKAELCKLGKERYHVAENANASFWSTIHDASVMKSLTYIVADLGQAQGWTAEQVSFALNADSELWAAFSGDDFTESQTQCQIIQDNLPINIWNDAEALQWKQNQQSLRKKIEHCHNVKFTRDRVLEATVDAVYQDSAICTKIKAQTIKAQTHVSLADVELATLQCKKEMIDALQLLENHFDDFKGGDDAAYLKQLQEANAKDGAIEFGRLAYWEDDMKGVLKKWFNIVEAIHVDAWTTHLDHKAKFCNLMRGASKDKLTRFTSSNTKADMKKNANLLNFAYDSAVPESPSGYVIIEKNYKGVHIKPVHTFQVNIPLGDEAVHLKAVQEDVYTKTYKTYENWGKPEANLLLDSDLITGHLAYNFNPDEITNHASEFASVFLNDIELQSGAKVKASSMEITPKVGFEGAQKALEAAGVTVTHTEYQCLLNVETQELTLAEDVTDAPTTEAATPAPESTEVVTEAPVTEAPTEATKATTLTIATTSSVTKLSAAFVLAAAALYMY